MEADNFDSWLSERFRELQTDEAVFVPYIKSIIEGDDTAEEKIDALDGILSELSGDDNLDVESFRNEIMLKWDKRQKSCSGANGAGGDAGVELESKMEKLMKLSENLVASSGANQNKTVDSALRAAILSQCQDSSDNESDGEGPSTSGGGGGGGGGGGMPSGLERNTNAERVQSELKDKREREKEASAKKREKDKEDRAKQKQQAQERKDKAKKKSAKVERKR